MVNVGGDDGDSEERVGLMVMWFAIVGGSREYKL